MSKVVVLNLGAGNLQDGFPAVTSQLGESNCAYRMKFTASLPAAPEIAQLYRNWQSLYSAFYQPFLQFRSSEAIDEADDILEIEEGCITNVSEVDIVSLCNQISYSINAWLDSREFRKIDRQLRTHLGSSEEIRFIVETDDILLRRLPWHLWSFFEDYPSSEVAVSTYNYQKQQSIGKYAHKNNVRILAIFGSSEGIDISQDRLFLEKLSVRAEIRFLVEPKLSQLGEQLWQEGWDIIFFAGHSGIDKQGFIHINDTDIITLDKLKNALKQAISRGLKLAIFNSCDGLGLAQELIELHIPQVIVMREPVPDKIAQEFLKYFLGLFSQGQSLYTAVRSARERLQVLEKDYPCATWLPLICQNPAEAPIIWSRNGIHTEAEEADKILPVNLEPVAFENGNQFDDVLPKNKRYIGDRYEEKFSLIDFKPKPSKKGHRLFDISYYPLKILFILSIFLVTFLMGIRHLGLLQPWELNAYDHLMQLRPYEQRDPRLLIVKVDDADIQYQIQQRMELRGSLSDQALAQLLDKLDQYEPEAIGLSIYRDFPSDPNYPNLATRFNQDKRLIAICKVSASSDGATHAVPPPPQVPKERHSFSDFVADIDGVPRRLLLFMNPPLNSPCTAEYAFSYMLARQYLNSQGYTEPQFDAQGNLQIGQVIFERLKSHSSSYQGVDAAGYQILMNYRSLPSFTKIADTVSLEDILNDKINPNSIEKLKDRIILIGTTAPSTTHFWKTPYISKGVSQEQEIPGVIVQAHILSQIISAITDNRPLIWWWPGWLEALWIWAWSLLGGIIAWRIWQPITLLFAITTALLLLFSICFGILISAGWVPLVPPALGLICCAFLLKILLNRTDADQTR